MCKSLTATKLRNQLLKRFGPGKLQRVFPDNSNPYCAWQTLELWLQVAKVKKMIEALKLEGWTSTEYSDGTVQLDLERNRIVIAFILGEKSDTREMRVNVTCPKKAKISNIPYYD